MTRSFDPLLSSVRQFLEEMATEVGEQLRWWFERTGLAIEAKADGSPVTAADRAAEDLLRQRVAERFPEHAFEGEERGRTGPEDAEYRWICDPIDGTVSFVHGVPLFGLMIALLRGDEPLASLVAQPVLGRTLIGDASRTTLNGEEVRVREARALAEATFLLTDPADPYWTQPAGAAFLRRPKVVRAWGDCFGYLLLASGRSDVMVDPVMEPWDLLPLLPVLAGAGATVSDLAGSRAGVGSRSLVAATAASLHAEVLGSLPPAPGTAGIV